VELHDIYLSLALFERLKEEQRTMKNNNNNVQRVQYAGCVGKMINVLQLPQEYQG
jgi:hypothetical protein